MIPPGGAVAKSIHVLSAASPLGYAGSCAPLPLCKETGEEACVEEGIRSVCVGGEGRGKYEGGRGVCVWRKGVRGVCGGRGLEVCVEEGG